MIHYTVHSTSCILHVPTLKLSPLINRLCTLVCFVYLWASQLGGSTRMRVAADSSTAK